MNENQKRLVAYALENLRVLKDPTGNWERYHQCPLWDTYDYDEVDFDNEIDLLLSKLNQ